MNMKYLFAIGIYLFTPLIFTTPNTDAIAKKPYINAEGLLNYKNRLWTPGGLFTIETCPGILSLELKEYGVTEPATVTIERTIGLKPITEITRTPADNNPSDKTYSEGPHYEELKEILNLFRKPQTSLVGDPITFHFNQKPSFSIGKDSSSNKIKLTYDNRRWNFSKFREKNDGRKIISFTTDDKHESLVLTKNYDENNNLYIERKKIIGSPDRLLRTSKKTYKIQQKRFYPKDPKYNNLNKIYLFIFSKKPQE